jgi:hypothetical protein
MTETRRARGVGEFLLLILGVFLALSAENWWAGREDRATAQSYAEDLEQDYRRASVVLGIYLRVAEEKVRANETLLAQLDAGPGPLDASTAFALYYAGARVDMRFGSPTYTELTASGDLRLLSRSLRRAVVVYERDLANRQSAVASYSQPLRGLGIMSASMAEVLRRSQEEWSSQQIASREHLARMVEITDSMLLVMPAPRAEALASWAAIPGVRQLIVRENHEARNWLRRLRDLEPLLDLALAAASAEVDR